MVANCFVEANPLVDHSPIASGLQVFIGLERAKQFEQGLLVQDGRVTPVFFKNIVYHHAETEKSSRMTSRYSCVKGLVGGGLGSFLMQHPLPLLFGLSQCLPGISAQQKVGGEFRINTYTSDYQAIPYVALLRNGNLIVVWQSNGQDGSGYGIYGQLLNNNGTPIGSEFRINTYTLNEQQLPSVTSLNNGNFVVAWPSWPPLEGRYQIFNNNGAKIGSELQITSNPQDVWWSFPIVCLKNGNFIIAWPGADSSGTGVFGQLFNESGSKIASEFRINTNEVNSQNVPAIASFNSGKFVVVWQSDWQDGSSWGVFGQLFDENAVKVGNEFQINTYTADDQDRPAIASLSTDNFVVTWQSLYQDGSSWGVYGQLFDQNGAKIGNEFQVNTYTTNLQGEQQMASLSNDHFIVAWRSDFQDGSDSGMYGQLFDQNCVKIGNEFRINTYTTSIQRYPSIASLQDKNFIITWQSWGQDGSVWGIYGQIFHDNLNFTSSTRTTSTFQTTTTTSRPVTSNLVRSTTTQSPSDITTIKRTTSTTHPMSTVTTLMTFDLTSKAPSPSANRNQGSFWREFFTGVLGGAVFLAVASAVGVLCRTLRNRKKEDDALELSERGTSRAATPPEGSRASQEGEYQYTPDHVTAV